MKRHLKCSRLLPLVTAAFVGACTDAPTAVNRVDPAFTMVTEGYDLGFSHYDCIYNITTDADNDGVDDGCEESLAVAFQPQLVVHYSDDVSREPSYAVNNSGGSIQIMYLLSYHRDLGSVDWLGFESLIPLIWKLGPHSGDSEFINLRLTSSGTVWKLQSVFLSAHWGVPRFCVLGPIGCFYFDRSSPYDHSELTYADVTRGRPRIWVSEDKHANYPSASKCNEKWDTCTQSTYLSNALVYTGRNIGSGPAPLMDSIGSQTPSYYTGQEAYWTEEDRFHGWYGSGWGGGSTPYNHALGTFDYYSGWDPEIIYVGINGPSEVQSYANCNWVVDVVGGNPPLEYLWFRDDELVSTDANYAGNTGGGDFILNLHVVDKYGFRASTHMGVTHTSQAEWCVER